MFPPFQFSYVSFVFLFSGLGKPLSTILNTSDHGKPLSLGSDFKEGACSAMSVAMSYTADFYFVLFSVNALYQDEAEEG